MNNENNKMNILSKPIIACLGAMICCLLWGSAFPFVKLGYALLEIFADDVPSQMVFAGLRFTIAGVIGIGIGSAFNHKFMYPSKKAVPKVMLLSLFQTILQYFFYYIGLANTSGVKASVIVGTNVFVALIISCLVFRLEKFTAAKLVGCIVGFAGIVIINLNSGASGGIDMNLSLMGEGFVFFSTFAYAFSSVLMKYWSNKENPMMLSGWQFLFGGAVMLVGGLLTGGRVTGFNVKSIMLLLYLAIVSAVAYSIWSMLLKYNPVSKISVYGFMNPVFGVVLSALILGESEQAFDIKGLVALVFVCVGIYIVNGRKNTDSE